MSTPLNILVPTDLSLESEYAVPYAHAMARRMGAKLLFVHVMRPLEEHLIYNITIPAADLDRVTAARRDEARLRLENLASNAAYQGIDAGYNLVQGDPVKDLLRLAKETESAVIVMATHGHSGFDARIFGSVCEKVVRMSRIPVMVVKHPEHECVRSDGSDIALRTVLCPVDFSAPSLEAARYAAMVVQRFGGSLVLAHVVQPHYENINYLPELAAHRIVDMKHEAQERLEALAQDLPGIPVEVMVRDGSAHRELVRIIEEKKVNLLIMGTRDNHRYSHGIFGSVAEKLLRLAACPIISLHPAYKPETDGVDRGHRVGKSQVSLFFA